MSYTNKHTVITGIHPINFNDEAAVQLEIKQFADKYVHDNVENALVITPSNNIYTLRGNDASVNPGIINRNELKGSIVIHNHPPDWPDSFGRMDFASFFEYGFSHEDVIAKKLWNTMRYEGVTISTEQAIMLYNDAFNTVRNRAFIANIQIEREQLETMRELSKIMKGLIFHEHTPF